MIWNIVCYLDREDKAGERHDSMPFNDAEEFVLPAIKVETSWAISQIKP